MVFVEVLVEVVSALAKAIALGVILSIYSGMDPSMDGPDGVQTNHVNGRLEVLTAVLNPENLVVGSHLTNEVKHHAQKSFEADDIIGVLIDEKLGGFANKTFNAVPMNPSTHETWRKKVTEPIIHDYLAPGISKENVTLIFTIIPFYEYNDTTRPNCFAVVVLAMNISSSIIHYTIKGLIPNPPKAEMSEAIVPYLYKTGNITAQGDQHCIYLTVEAGENQLEDRVEMITMQFNASDISPCRKIDGKRNEVQLRKNDVQSLLISEKFGGRPDDPFNVVPMHPSAVRELKTRVEQPIIDYIKSTKDIPDAIVWLNMMLIYSDSLATRPAGFVVRSSIKTGKLFDPMYIPNTGKIINAKKLPLNKNI
uniref:Uncharacterized protein n=1 Tax=Lygus hesperus TaxID=30085 RepID=A0A146LI63_LYGHE